METARKIFHAINTPVAESNIDDVRYLFWEALDFVVPSNFVLAIAPVLAEGISLSVDYDLTFMDCIEEMISSIKYTTCFQEFYSMTKMIPILNHGDGRIFDLYDTATESIIQFNVMDPPSEWIVLNSSFVESVNNFRDLVSRLVTDGMPLPHSLYGSDHFQTVKELFPARAVELDNILPNPLVLRTHQAGTWQIDRIDEIHRRIQSSDDRGWIYSHLVSHPEDLCKPTSKGSQPLHIAAENGRIGCLQEIIIGLTRTGGVSLLTTALNARNVSHETPLLCAASKLYTHNQDLYACISHLVESGADVCCAQDEGMTLLHFAAGSCSMDIINLAMSKGASVFATTAYEYGARTPLHKLCSSRNFRVLGDLKSCAVALLAAGADVNARDTSGSTPLHMVMWGSGGDDCSELVECLLQAGADPNATTSGYPTSVLDSGFARDKYYSLLCRYGAVDNAAGSRRDEGAIEVASSITLTAADFRRPPQPVLRSANAIMGMTAQAAIQGFVSRTRSLLDFVRERDVEGVRAKLAEPGCDPNDAPEGIPPIVFAANAGAPELIELLLAAGADVNAKDSNGIGAIHGAQPECLELLLRRGADPNMLDRHGQSSLTQALDFLPSGEAKLEYCSLLLQYGADLNVGRSGTSQLTPLEIIQADPTLMELLTGGLRE